MRISDWSSDVCSSDLAYLNTKAIEQRGLAPIQGELQAIAALKDKQQLATMLGANLLAAEDPINATHLGSETLFGLFVTQALRSEARRAGEECVSKCRYRW